MSTFVFTPLSLKEQSLRALKAQEFINLEPDDPLNAKGFVAICTIGINSYDVSKNTYEIDTHGSHKCDLKSMQTTLQKCEENRAGFGLKDGSISIYVIFVLDTRVILRIGFPQMTKSEGMVKPIGGHIDLAGKQPVIAAGQVLFTKLPEGFGVKGIDNRSGHYQPTEMELHGKLVKTPWSITAQAFRLGLGALNVKEVYQDPEYEKVKQRKLEERLIQEKSGDLSKATPSEKKLLEVIGKVRSDGGVNKMAKSTIQSLSSVIAKAMANNQGLGNVGVVGQFLTKEKDSAKTLQELLISAANNLGATLLLRPEWIKLNIKE